ncbi:MAG: hypothetical protein AB3N14_04480 [Flavobacteriaceae bacterium]
MRNFTLGAILLAFCFGANAQWSTSGGKLTTTNNVAIGSTNAIAKLNIESTTNGKMLRIVGKNKDLDIYMGNPAHNYGFYWRYKGIQSGNNNLMEFWSDNQASSHKRVYYVKQDGNIYFEEKMAIGTNSFGSHRLAVEGSIGAREVVVEGGGWSDFVFEEDYNLPTLSEVEDFINTYGHLKDIPSAKKVEQEGITLGEMDAKLLQKIEELTLYVIELNKKDAQQERALKALKEENRKLSKLLSNSLEQKKGEQP